MKMVATLARVVVASVLSSCSDPETTAEVATIEAPAPAPLPSIWSERKLHKAIREKNPDYTGNGMRDCRPLPA